MSEQDTERPIDDDWLLRHHITRVVEWAIAKVGQAILLATLGSIVAGLLASASDASAGTVVGVASLVGTLVFGIVLWNASGPYPLPSPDDVDD